MDRKTADVPPQQRRRMEPMPTPPPAPTPWTATSTVHDVLHSAVRSGLTLRSTVGQLCNTLQVMNDLRFTHLLKQWGDAAIGEVASNNEQPLLMGLPEYNQLKSMALSADFLEAIGVHTLAHWSAWGGPQEYVSELSRVALNEAVRKVGLLPPIREDLEAVITEDAGESVVQGKVALPLVELIRRMLVSLLPQGFRSSIVCIGNASWASAGGTSRPDLMLVSSKPAMQYCHMLSCEVKAPKAPDGDEALAQAMSCGAFLTPNTGYSVIVVGVRGSQVEMGLMTVLKGPDTPTGPNDEVSFQGVRAQLPPLPQSLFKHPRTGKETGLTVLERADLTWGVEFEYTDMAGAKAGALTEYISILCKPIVFGMKQSKGHERLGGSVDDCHILLCNNVPSELQLTKPHGNSSADIIVKRMTVRMPEDLADLHAAVGIPFQGQYTCALSMKLAMTPSNTASRAAASDCASDGTRKEKDEELVNYKQLCCVYKYTVGTTVGDGRLSSLGHAVLLCMVAAAHDDLSCVHCDIRGPNMLLKPMPSSDRHTLKLIDWGYGLKLNPEQRLPELPMHDRIRVVKAFETFLGKGALNKLTERVDAVDQDDKKAVYYRLLDINSILDLIGCGKKKAEFKELIKQQKKSQQAHQSSREVVKYLVINFKSSENFKRVAQEIQKHRLLSKRYADLEAFSF